MLESLPKENMTCAKSDIGSMLKLRRWATGGLIVVTLLGCRHPAPPAQSRTGAARAFEGDPATNVMIVPASALWRARGNGTNRLAPGIIPGNPFPFPDYDQALVKSIYDRWLQLLNAQPQPGAQGSVAVEFFLHANGSVSRIRRLPSDVTPRLEQLCERAILELAPFPKWPAPMLDEIGADFRLIRVSFDFDTNKQSNASDEKRAATAQLDPAASASPPTR